MEVNKNFGVYYFEGVYKWAAVYDANMYTKEQVSEWIGVVFEKSLKEGHLVDRINNMDERILVVPSCKVRLLKEGLHISEYHYDN